jgi:hypothetical protein
MGRMDDNLGKTAPLRGMAAVPLVNALPVLIDFILMTTPSRCCWYACLCQSRQKQNFGRAHS